MRSHTTMIAAFVLIVWGVAVCSTGLAETDKEFIPGQDSGFYYTIKKGDTLWDLSQKFYNSKWDWPGLWEMNDEIKNPHWIYPGKKIRIFLKEKQALSPKPAMKIKKTMPVKIEPSFSFTGMDHIGFIKKTAVPSLGHILKEQDGNLMMATNDIIYIKPSGNGTLIPGSVYHVFNIRRVEEKVHDKTFNGVQHIIKAKIKILEHKGTYATGILTNSYKTVYKDDLIMAYHERDSILNVEERPVQIDARIICSEDHNVMINDYRIAFIDVGNTRIKPGQVYSILQKNEIKDTALWSLEKKTPIELADLEAGKLIVLHTEDIASTVMILSSKDAIHPDDIVN